MAQRIASTLIAALIASSLVAPGAAAAQTVPVDGAGTVGAVSSGAVRLVAPGSVASELVAAGSVALSGGPGMRAPADLTVSGVRAGVADPEVRLVFTRECDVWIARPDGSDATNLTADIDLCAIQPSISRTGRYVAYGIGVGSGSEVWIHDRETGTSAPLAAAVGGGQVSFSPTTDAFAFSRFDLDTVSSNIFSIEVDGTGLKQWTFDTSEGDSNFEPAWSPDGSSILHSNNHGSWHCRVDQGGYYDLRVAYRLARATGDGTVVEVEGSDAFSIWGAAEGGGVLAYVRQPMPPGPDGGICAHEVLPGTAELVVDGAVVDQGLIGDVTVTASGEVAYARGDEVVVRAADGAQIAVFPGGSPSWGVDHRAGGGGSGGDGDGGDDDGPASDQAQPVARCDVYWTTPGSRLRVPRVNGILANDVDPEGLAIRPQVTRISFRKASHPYTVSRDGSLVLQTLSTDAKLVLDYRVTATDGRRSTTSTITILVSKTKPSASALRPCPPVDEVTSRDLRAKKKRKQLPTAFPTWSSRNMAILQATMHSWNDWRYVLKRKNQSPYWAMDFAHDNCSAPKNLGNTWGFRFLPFCIRHDFAYRNGLWLGVFDAIRPKADRNFYNDLRRYCSTRGVLEGVCNEQAKAFYVAVREGGGDAVPEARKSYAGAGSVRIATVFTPIDNFYIRGWVRDTKADGANVRLQYIAAVTGPNKGWRTVASTKKGNGTQQAFDFSYNGKLNLKGIWFRICLVERGDLTCGKRFYVNKPD